jgi:hypothetical protein
MTAELLKSIPLTLNGTGADLKAIPAVQENWYASVAGGAGVSTHPAGGSLTYGHLTTDSTNASPIGTYTDTFYNEAIGTHPGSSLSIGSVTTTLYQNKDSVDAFDPIYRTVAHDSDGNIFEMDSASFFLWGERLLETNLLNEYTGNFRLSSSAPSASWEVFENAVFADTKTNSSTDYNLYRKVDDTDISLSAPTSYTLQLVDSDGHHLQEMSLADASASAYLAVTHAKQTTGLSDYLLLPSSETPSGNGESGTWVARGTAIDTRNTVENLQYSSPLYTSPAYSSQFTRSYAGQYTGVSYADISGSFSGTRTNFFSGTRTYSANYAGVRSAVAHFDGSRSYSATTAFGGSRSYSAQYAGTRPSSVTTPGSFSVSVSTPGSFSSPVTTPGSFSSPVSTPGSFSVTVSTPGTFSVVSPVNYTGTRSTVVSQQFAGASLVAGQFAGTLQFGNIQVYSGTRQYLGSRQANYSGSRVSFNTVNYNGPTLGNQIFLQFGGVNPAQYTGVRTPTRPGAPPTPDGPGIYIGSPVTQQFTGTITAQYSGDRIWQFTGVRVVTVATNYLGPLAQNFTGAETSFTVGVQYTGIRPNLYSGTRASVSNYAGTRTVSTPGQFAGSVTSNYAGVRGGVATYAGVRTGVASYAGVRTGVASYAGVRGGVTTYAGSRTTVVSNPAQFDGSRSYSGSYTGSRVSTYSGFYAGVRSTGAQFGGSRSYTSSFAGNVTQTFSGTRPAVYSAQYTGFYSSQYTGFFTSQYASQYTGQTLVAISEVVETFTLYCRISES